MAQSASPVKPGAIRRAEQQTAIASRLTKEP